MKIINLNINSLNVKQTNLKEFWKLNEWIIVNKMPTQAKIWNFSKILINLSECITFSNTVKPLNLKHV
jgi:hypothetical protein